MQLRIDEEAPRRQTLAETGSLAIGDDPDDIRWQGGRFHPGYGSSEKGAIATLDPTTLAVVSTLDLPAHPESFQVAPDGRRVFVNGPWSKRATAGGTVIVGDLASRRIANSWSLSPLAQNLPMALDAENHRLYVATRRPAKLVSIDASVGRVITRIDCIADADDVFVGRGSRTIYVVGGGDGGAIEVATVDAEGRLDRAASVETGPRARTALYIPERGALYVAVPPHEGRGAEVREYLVSE